MNLNRAHLLLAGGMLASGLATAAIVGSGLWAGPVAAGPVGVAIHGLEATLTLEELSKRADLVVVGTARSEATRRFTSLADIPVAERDPLIYPTGAFVDVTFAVREYIKGSGGREVSVRRLAASPTLIIEDDSGSQIEVGRDYVLFLERGRGLWSGGYVIMGQQGAGVIVGDVVDLPAHGATSLAALRKAVNP